jgi:hypothetical protein
MGKGLDEAPWDTPPESAPWDASFDQLSSRVGSKPIGACTDQYITYGRFSEVDDGQVSSNLN